MIDAASLVEVILVVDADQAELAQLHLGELNPGGFRCDDLPDGGVELAVYVDAENAHRPEVYLAASGITIRESRLSPIAGDWAERWKEFHQPVVIGGLWVGPPWQLDDAPAGLRPLIIEPGQGFGTGAHATTRLMLTLLHDLPRASILDVGCGSGVLSIAAAMLGFGPVTAIDNDPAAIVSTEENIARNDLHGITVRLLDGLAETLPQADIVLANITLLPLQRLAAKLHAPCVVVSGLLRSQVETCIATFEQYEYYVQERRDRDGWTALVLKSARPDEQAMYHRTVI